ncbi:MAG: hypothetical protein Q7S45_00560 [Candidatus Curtissbacteria bacterium]|nr:hypothetical protein [Candidatus Curtissbacteria bacterium]
MALYQQMQTLIRNILVSTAALAVFAAPAFAQSSTETATPSSVVTSGFDKNTALVILVVVALVIIAAWWYTKEEDEAEGTEQSRSKETQRKKR